MLPYEWEFSWNEIVRHTQPPTLYHYSSTGALESIIEEGFWVSHTNFLNDPSEVRYTYHLLRSELEKLGVHEDHLLSILSSDDSASLVDAFVLSLSEDPDSLTLWSNYGQSDGCNIGVNAAEFDKLVCDIQGVKVFMGKVEYDVDMQREFLFCEAKKFAEWYRAWVADTSDFNALQKSVDNFIQFIQLSSCFFKNPLFKSESEYRYVFFPSGQDKRVKFRHARGALIPYIEVPTRYGPSGGLACVVESVRIGPRNKADIVESGIKYYMSYRGFKNIHVDTSEIPLRF
ncbi:DUF2971 domain-containing protein [Alicyclobacillus sp. ALC3]|uniref:DUF2971 domain-containing protein n=1 Tax=Alicyclobacillus sp. ALC3 TaxID=2796143 RepID=UPI002379B65D|nr:DUF2971 domain-containing protein [Alicyclobacillus sp. ALC3]WDL96392.1 DUF2971 domain-containing protein [Alicyclobacillus sp. ALC3]